MWRVEKILTGRVYKYDYLVNVFTFVNTDIMGNELTVHFSVIITHIVCLSRTPTAFTVTHGVYVLKQRTIYF